MSTPPPASPPPRRGGKAPRSPTDEVITQIWRRAALLAVILLVLTVALVAVLTATHTPTGRQAPVSTSRRSGASTPTGANATTPAPTSAPTTGPPPSTAAPAVTAPSPPALAASVAVLPVTFVDPSRPTVSNGQELATSRTLPTNIYLPADAAGAPEGTSLPLVIFLHGFAVAPPTYDAMLRTWAQHGYVVAAPTLPLTSSASGANTDEHDLINEPGDASFLLTSLLARSAQAGDPLSGRIDPGRIAVAGHSDGADVAFLIGFSTTMRDPRVKAIVDLSGDLLEWTGPYTSTAASPPILQIVSDADAYVPLDQAEKLYAAVCCHKYWVLLHGPEHLQPFTSPANPWTPIVDEVTVAFLDRFVGGYAVPVQLLDAAANQPPLSRLEASTP